MIELLGQEKRRKEQHVHLPNYVNSYRLYAEQGQRDTRHADVLS